MKRMKTVVSGGFPYFVGAATGMAVGVCGLNTWLGGFFLVGAVGIGYLYEQAYLP